MRTLRATAPITLIYLLLGFITTWAVAWSLALLPPTLNPARTRQPMLAMDACVLGTRLEVHHSLGGMRVAYVNVEHLIVGSEAELEANADRPFIDAASDPTPWTNATMNWNPAGRHGWGMRREVLTAGPDSLWSMGVDDGLGFPAIALWCSWEATLKSGWFSIDGNKEPHGGFRIHNVSLGRFNGTIPRALPYRPIWSGLGINTAFYALLLFGIVRGSRRIKHAGRYRRGVCPRCRYDRCFDYTSPCPKCGDAPRKAKRAHPAARSDRPDAASA